jgi:hypothetical protein
MTKPSKSRPNQKINSSARLELSRKGFTLLLTMPGKSERKNIRTAVARRLRKKINPI